MIHRSRFGGCLLASLLLIWLASCGDAPPPDSTADSTADSTGATRRNLIWIVVDTLRADALGVYGGDVPTPFLDSLAASGVRFERAYSHIPLTGPSHASFFTSGLPSDHGCVVNSQVLDEANVTLAEILRNNGYETAAFVSLGVLSNNFGFSQGFESYSDYFPGRWWKSADEMNALLTDWLARSPPSEPSFLFLHYSDPHTPYAPPDEVYTPVTLRIGRDVFAEIPTDSRLVRIPISLPPGLTEIAFQLPAGSEREDYGCGRVSVPDPRVRIRFSDESGFHDDESGAPPFPELPTAMRILNPTQKVLDVQLALTLRMNLSPEMWSEWYAKEVAYVDAQLAMAVDALKEVGLWEDSVIVFTSDHGEGLGEHGHMQHVEQLYDSLLRIPLVMVAPGLLPAGEEVSAPVRHVDVLPTVLDLLGLADFAASTFSPFRGSSLLPLIEHGTGPRPPVVSVTHTPEARHDQRSIVFQGYKYIVNETTGEEELYSLADDPGELENLAAARSEQVLKLKQLLAVEFERHYGPIGLESEMPELSEEDRAQLEALGYLR